MKRILNSWQLLALLVVIGAVLPWLLVGGAGPVLPRSLGELDLQHEVLGVEAAAMVNDMHGRPVAEARHAIGYYGSTRGGAVLYVTMYLGDADARDAEGRMGAKIATGEYVFQEYRTGVVDGKSVAACTGLGQTHFIFSHGSFPLLAVGQPRVGRRSVALSHRLAAMKKVARA